MRIRRAFLLGAVGGAAVGAVVALGHPRVRGAATSPLPRRIAPGQVRLSVVVPAFEEEGRIGDTLAALRSGLADVAAAGGLELVVVDDGSSDATAVAAKAGGADVVVVQPSNLGKGAAVRAGMAGAAGRTVAFTDADQAYSAADVGLVLAAVEAGWDVALGSRRHVETTTLVRQRALREITGRVFNLLTRLALLGRYRDTQCGLKAFRSDVAAVLVEQCHVDGFAFDVEVLHLVERYGWSAVEIPVHVRNRAGSTVSVGGDALDMVRDVARIRRWSRRGAYDPAAAARAGLA